MATVYKIEIETVSAWVNHTPQEIEKELKEFLESKKNFGMESTEIKVERKS